MAEQAPQGEKIADILPVGSEQARLAAIVAKHQARADAAKTQLEGYKNFGGDEVTAPNKGEDTYQSYMAQRPSEGVVRDVDGFRDAATGKFASEGDYQKQTTGNINDYYDKVNGIADQAEYQPPDYDSMSFMELVKAARQAQNIGDPLEVKAIRDAAEHNLMEQATREHTDSPLKDADPKNEWTQEQFDAEMARFDSLVGKDPYEKKEDEPADHRGESVKLGEEQGTVSGVFKDEVSGREVYEVTLTDGSTRLSDLSGLTFNAPDGDTTPGKAAVHVPELDHDGDTNGGKTTFGEKLKAGASRAGKAVAELIDDAGFNKAKEDVKAWWAANKDKIKPAYTMAWMGERFTAAQNWLIDRGVNYDTMTEQEQIEKREKNRRVLLLGVTGSLVALAGLASIGVFSHHNDVSAMADPNALPPTGGEGISGDASGSIHGAGAPETISGDATGQIAVEAPAVPDANFNIPNGGGGEALFNRLGIPAQQWYTNEQTLLNRFPQDFYLMDGGHVGISHPGMLSQGAQDFINKLRP